MRRIELEFLIPPSSEIHRGRILKPKSVSDIVGKLLFSYDRKTERITHRPQFFEASIVAATILPIVVFAAYNLLNTKPGFGSWLVPLWVGFALVSGTHVFSTCYLLFDTKEHTGVERKAVNLLAIPLIILFANFGILYVENMKWVMFFFVFYAHYSWYHFYRQNMGVFAFSCQISRRKPMTSFERRSIWAGVAAGVLATYHNASPAGLIDQTLYPFDISIIDPYFSRVHHLGQLLYIILIPLVLAHIWRNWGTFTRSNLTLYLCSVFFSLPMYIPSLSSYLAYVPVAHGLQYLVFILFHALQRSHDRCDASLRTMPRATGLSKFIWVMLPIVFAISMIALGYLLWQVSAKIQAKEISISSLWLDNLDAIKFTMGLILGLTMAHYWVDQHLWKFRNTERRSWLYGAFPFLSAESSPARH